MTNYPAPDDQVHFIICSTLTTKNSIYSFNFGINVTLHKELSYTLQFFQSLLFCIFSPQTPQTNNTVSQIMRTQHLYVSIYRIYRLRFHQEKQLPRNILAMLGAFTHSYWHIFMPDLQTLVWRLLQARFKQWSRFPFLIMKLSFTFWEEKAILASVPAEISTSFATWLLIPSYERTLSWKFSFTSSFLGIVITVL